MHECAHPECHEKIESTRLACVRHWRQLPRRIQEDINATWRRRLHEGSKVAVAYHDRAKAAAIAWWTTDLEERRTSSR